MRGTRISVEIIVRMLKNGYTPNEIHEEYPSLPLKAIEMIQKRIRERKPFLVEIKA